MQHPQIVRYIINQTDIWTMMYILSQIMKDLIHAYDADLDESGTRLYYLYDALKHIS